MNVTTSNAHGQLRWSMLTLVGLLVMTGALGSAVVAGRALPPASSTPTLDQQFAAVASAVPEFAGMALGDNESTLIIDLTDVSEGTVEAARDAIIDVFGPQVIPPGGMRVHERAFSFLQLQDWRDTLLAHLVGVAGVTLLDIDEARNLVRVGVTAGARREVAARLAGLAVPAAAVLLEESTAVVPLSHTLKAAMTVKQGGYVLTSMTSNGVKIGTLGFNAWRAGVPGLVTVSHGTQVWFMADAQAGYPATPFSQSEGYDPQKRVGVETVDPTGPLCPPPYPSGHRCRFSDSAFVRYDAGVSWAQGILARTIGLTKWDGAAPCANPTNPQCIVAVDHTFTKNSGAGTFGISSVPSTPYLLGLQLQKLGRVTGWTRGVIDATCVDYVVAANGIDVLFPTVLRCQYELGNQTDSDPTNDWWRIATKGDSGSPVFRITSGTFKRVELYGLLWGGNMFSNSFGAKKLVFSPIAGVEADLGPLDYVNTCLPPSLACS